MASQALVLVAVLVASPVLAGCTGGDPGDEVVRKQRADVTEVTGGIEGIVTDDAFQPVVGGNVTLVERDLTTRTASDGSYAFSRVIPGVYTLSFSADGFVSATQTVTVVRNEVAAIDFVVTHLFTEEAYETVFERAGFMECGFAWYQELVELGRGIDSNALALCAVTGIAVDNATNDRFLTNIYFDPPIENMIYEMEWVSASVSADSALKTSVDQRAHVAELGSRIVDIGGVSPLYVRVERASFEDLQKNYTDRCEEGADSWCGFNFFDDGWEFTIRVFADNRCTDLPVRVCPQFQQEFTHYITGFFNAPAPEGYSIIQGNAA